MEKIIDYLKKEYDKLDTSIFELSDALMGAAATMYTICPTDNENQ